MPTITLPITKSLIKYENLLCNKIRRVCERKTPRKVYEKGPTGKNGIVMVDLMKIMKIHKGTGVI